MFFLVKCKQQADIEIWDEGLEVCPVKRPAGGVTVQPIWLQADSHRYDPMSNIV